MNARHSVSTSSRSKPTVLEGSPVGTASAGGLSDGAVPDGGASPRGDTASRRRVLASMCLSLALVVASVSALNLALPSLAIELSASTSALTWIADGYTVALAAFVLVFGAIGDRYGRRNVLLGGTVLFSVAALWASTADTTSAVIAARVLMGMGAAAIMPGTLATITAVFPDHERARAVATWAGVASAGAVVGLLGAGALLERFGWQSIFVATGVLGVVSMAVAAVGVPNTRESTATPIDWLGAALAALAIGATVFGIIEGAEVGWGSPVVLVALFLSFGAAVAYVENARMVAEPLVDPQLFTRRTFTAGTLTILVQFMAVFGFFFVGLQFLQLMLGYSPLLSAVALLPVAAVVMPTSQLTPHLVERFGMRVITGAGLGALAGGMAIISSLDTSATYLDFLGGLIVAGFGIGITSSTGTAAIVGSLGSDQQGVASAINDAGREIGAALGIAVMGAAYGSAYRDALPPAPEGAPPEIVEAIRHSAAAGFEVANRAGSAGGPVREAVGSAFMAGVRASSLLIAIVLGVAAVAIAKLSPPRAWRATRLSG